MSYVVAVCQLITLCPVDSISASAHITHVVVCCSLNVLLCVAVMLGVIRSCDQIQAVFVVRDKK